MKKAILLVTICLLVIGCAPVQMSAEYGRAFRLANVNVAELNRRCQDGDDMACKEGLKEASEILQTVVDAMDGRE